VIHFEKKDDEVQVISVKAYGLKSCFGPMQGSVLFKVSEVTAFTSSLTECALTD